MSDETPAPPGLTDDERAELLKRAADAARRAREVDARPSVDPAPFAVILKAIQEIAAEKTGLTVQEILEQGASMPPPDDPNGPIELRRMKQAGVEKLHREHMLTPNECDALTSVRTMLASERPILVLSGTMGTCKTGSACWMLGQHWGGCFAKAKQLLRLAIEKPAQYETLARARYVVLDDLGTEVHDDKGHWLATFTDLFDDWYAGDARLILTCNLTRDDFKARYGERVADRIRERGRFVTLGGASVRK
jgi:hypothetical protein